MYVNDQLKGPSPVTYDFVWYGWHRVTLRKEGYERLDDRQLLRAPIYFWIPFDLAIELLPFPIRDARAWSYVLTPAPEVHGPVSPDVVSAAAAGQPLPSSSEPPAPAQGPAVSTGADAGAAQDSGPEPTPGEPIGGPPSGAAEATQAPAPGSDE